MNKPSALAIAAGSLFLLGAQTGEQTAMAMGEDKPGSDKCYGVVKVAMNDCHTAVHGCAGLATADRDPREWLYMPKGFCERLAGGSLKAPASAKKKDK